MRNLIQLIIIILFVNTSFAQQPCNDDVIMNVKGKWKKRSDANMKADKNQAQIISRIDAVSKLFQTAYPEPKGIEAGWNRTMSGNPAINNGPVPYQFNSLYLDWYCNPNLPKLMLAVETGTWSYVFINDLEWFMGDQYDQASVKIEDNVAYMLPKLVGQWKGLSLYEPSGNSRFNEHRAVLITRNNLLPYKPVSRLQYVHALEQKFENEKKIQIDLISKSSVKTDAQEELAKQQGLENIAKNNRLDQVERRKASYLKNYKTEKQNKEEQLRWTEKNYDDKIKAIEALEKKYTSEELVQPAIIDEDHDFKDFSTQEKGGRMIVLINTAYFNMQLPRYAPQFMVLYWRSQNNAPSQNFKKQFEENFPVDKLKEMIDK
jgi:hypothetical protein